MKEEFLVDGAGFPGRARLVQAYEEAVSLDEGGLRGLCPSYVELTEADTRYQDSVLIGTGAVKEVYKTFNNHTQRWVAMARLRKDRGPEFYDLFVHEAWLTASLAHPNIITIHDVGVDETGRPFFSMDLKGESSLADRASGPQPADRRDLLEIFLKVCDAVAYAHSRGVVHLDLKPENIQADHFGEVLVCDWGLAKRADEPKGDDSEFEMMLRPMDNMTLMGQIKGSLGYMAPEQVQPGALKDARCDIYSLGCLLHLILTGEPPFQGSPQQVLEATRRGVVPPLRARFREAHIPEALEAVVLKATAATPDDRYASVQQLRSDMVNFLGGYSTLAEQPGFFREARLFLVRNRLPATITLFAIVTLSVVSVLFVQGVRRQRQRAMEFATKAETVETLYQDELQRSKKERQALALDLVTSASNLKRLGIFMRPVETVREARKLVDSAFALDSACPTARLQQFSLECIMLDFKGAMKSPVVPKSSLADYLLFSEAFSEFNYSETLRPEVEQLVAFLRQALELNPRRGALMERIVAYDAAARKSREQYAQVVEALLCYVNPQTELALEHHAEDSVLSLKANERIRLTIWDEWGSNECLLRFLPFRHFKPEVADRFYLGDLQGLHIETLDLRGCEAIVVNHAVSLPLLRQVWLRPNQGDLAMLKRSIVANEPVQFIELQAGAQ